jgi:hypothetical protein
LVAHLSIQLFILQQLNFPVNIIQLIIGIVIHHIECRYGLMRKQFLAASTLLGQASLFLSSNGRLHVSHRRNFGLLHPEVMHIRLCGKCLSLIERTKLSSCPSILIAVRLLKDLATKKLFLTKGVIHFRLLRGFCVLVSAVRSGLRVIGHHMFDLAILRWLALGKKVDPFVKVEFLFLIYFCGLSLSLLVD